MKDTAIADIMVVRVITVGVEDRLSRVEERMRVNGIRHVPVIDEKGRVAGIFTQRDLFRAISPRPTEEGTYVFDRDQLDTYRLRHFMTANPLTLRPEDSVARAVELMGELKYGCIPIVDGGKKLVGIVTQIDILKFLARKLREAA